MKIFKHKESEWHCTCDTPEAENWGEYVNGRLVITIDGKELERGIKREVIQMQYTLEQWIDNPTGIKACLCPECKRYRHRLIHR